VSKQHQNPPSNARREIVTPDGLVTVPPDSPRILIHTRGGKVICCHGSLSPNRAKVEPDISACKIRANLAML
jgi:hypothetical protein